jgi:branched-chain amino acid transport system ATP-binding protein
MVLLDVISVTKDFGGLRANDDISFSLDKGELLGLIGPNGAGKTTLFNCISGLYPVTSGEIIFDSEDITELKAHDVARRGLARTFQVYVASGDLTVEENVMVGCFMRTRSRSEAKSRADEILEFMKLQGMTDYMVSELPAAGYDRLYGQRTASGRPEAGDHGDRAGFGSKAVIARRGCRRLESKRNRGYYGQHQKCPRRNECHGDAD